MQQHGISLQRNDILQMELLAQGPRHELIGNNEHVNDRFLRSSNTHESSEKKGFFNTWLWQGIKIGAPVALGFLMPGIGFLFSTAIIGTVIGLSSTIEKLAVKNRWKSEDTVEVLTDFGMGFLGGALAKIPIFNGAKTYFSALIKSALGGGSSGSAVGGVGQAIKDKINNGEVKEEKILEGMFSGFLGGAAFGGAFGLFGHHLQICMQRKSLETLPINPSHSNAKIQEPLSSLPKGENTKPFEVINKTKDVTSSVKAEIKEEFKKLVLEIRTKLKDLQSIDPSQQGFQQCMLRSKIIQFQNRLNQLDPGKKQYCKLYLRLDKLLETINQKPVYNTPKKVPNPEVKEIKRDFEKLIQDVRTIIEDPKNKGNTSFLQMKLSGYKLKIWDLQSRLKKTDPTRQKYNKLRSHIEDLMDVITQRYNCTFDKLSWLQNNSSSKLPKGFFTAKDGGWDRTRQLDYYLKKSRLYEPPDNLENIAAWAKRLTGRINRLKKIAKLEGEENFIKVLELSRQNGYKLCLSKYSGEIRKLSEQTTSKYFSIIDIQPGSNFRQKLSALIKATRIFDKNYIEITHPELVLIHLSKPKFALNFSASHNLKQANQQAEKKLSVSDLIRSLVVRKKETSDGFYESVLRGVICFPEKALRMFKRFGYKFLAKHHTSQGRESELGQMTPNQFDPRTHYDQSGGLANYKHRELTISENMILEVNKFSTKVATFTDPVSYSQIAVHEGGHGLDRILCTLIKVRKLNSAKTFEEYMNLLQKFKLHKESYTSGTSQKFKTAYMEDISKLSPKQQEDLKYFLYQETPGDYSRGMKEAFAEGTCFLQGIGSSDVNFSTFPKTLRVMLQIFDRFIGIYPGFSFHLSNPIKTN